MSDERREKRWMRFGVGLVIVGMIAAVAVMIWEPGPRLGVGQVVDRMGMYRFPTGSQRLSVTIDPNNNLSVRVLRRTWSKYIVFPVWIEVDHAVFESERDWFLAVDQYERVWIYRGPWEERWGASRRMIGGGTIPLSPEVVVYAALSVSGNRLVGGTDVVSSTGRWGGVPENFFRRIPNEYGTFWGMRSYFPKFPSSPPSLRASEEAGLQRNFSSRQSWR